ncbi:MAG: DNA alkylation repair protein, partial [Herbiconiux sp.]|nr:DNA alkylation repair protein [Herbiconiux sp.]
VRATVRNAGATRAQFAVDYVVHYRKARGPNTPKVFKMATVTLDPGESRELKKRRSFAPTSTRVLHPGPHSVELQVNGRRHGEARVELRAASTAKRP